MPFHGKLDTVNGRGVNRMIREGAILVTNVNDIFDEIPEFQDFPKMKVNHTFWVKKEYRRIYNVLSDEPKSLDEIAYQTRNSPKCTLNLLSLMELEDLVEEMVGAGYVRKFKKGK